jgi:hypothetical protein
MPYIYISTKELALINYMIQKMIDASVICVQIGNNNNEFEDLQQVLNSRWNSWVMFEESNN